MEADDEVAQDGFLMMIYIYIYIYIDLSVCLYIPLSLLIYYVGTINICCFFLLVLEMGCGRVLEKVFGWFNGDDGFI